MAELDPSDTVPLFEKYQDLYLNRICSAMNLSVSDSDGSNVNNVVYKALN